MNTEENHIFDAAELRKQAEELARSREAEQQDLEAMTPEETRQVLHELRVHQIQLEMQNSELRKAQMELATEQQRYFDLYDLAPVGYCSISEKGLILKANLMVATLLGVNRGALLNQRFSQFILKDDQDNYYQHRKQIFKTGEPLAFELQLVKEDRTLFWARLEAVAAQGDDGELTCRVVISDVSERKRSNELLRESERRYRTLADNGQALIWTATPDKLCDYFNEPWLAFTGRTLEQEVGNGWTEGVHPDDFSRCLDIYVTAFDARQSFSMEYRLRHHSGEYRWIVDKSTPRHDSQGEFLGYIGHCLDIDELKRAEALVIEMKDKAEAANKAKSDFLATMSHEIRTPMNAIINLTGLTLLSELTSEQRDYLDTVLKSSDNLLAIINDLLDFSKIEARGVELDNVDFDLPETIASTVRTMSTQTEVKGLFLRLEIAPDSPRWVKGDSGRLRQVLFNLIGNAKKFTQAGGITVQLRVEQLDEKNQSASPAYKATVSVTDTGIGIPKDKQQGIFDMFSQVDPGLDRRFGGTGLGLAISRRLVEAMGGSLDVKSEPGAGSTFTFSVQLATGVEVAPKSCIEIPKPCTQGQHILVAEDDTTNALVIKVFLGKMGHKAEVVSSGDLVSKAIRDARAAGNPFDLVLMDVQMPGMDGFEATQALRSGVGGESDMDIPIVAMTAHALDGFRERCLAAGMDDYVTKPVEFDKLPVVIARVLEAKHKA